MNHHHQLNLWVAPFLIVLLIWVLFFLIRISGSTLARRFRAEGPFNGETWNWQSARFTMWSSYNNGLTIGASPEGLYLSVSMMPRFLLLFNLPALLVPWQEIEVETGKELFGLHDMATFRIGTEERVTVKIYGKLVDRIRQTAGPGWPLYYQEEMGGKMIG